MKDFMIPVTTIDCTEQKHYDKKGWIGEKAFYWYRCKISRDSAGKVSLENSEWKIISDNLKWIIFDDSERLCNTVLFWEIIVKIKWVRVMDNDAIEEMFTFPKEAIEEIIDKTEAKIIFVAFETLEFLGKDLRNTFYEHRKMLAEDVIISIDSVFEMKYKDNYALSMVIPHSRKSFEKLREQGVPGIHIRNTKGFYVDGVNEDWQQIMIDPFNTNPESIWVE